MAQAVAAQALARAGDLLSDSALLDAADRAYASIPALLSPSSPAKPWIALYSFDRVPVLNAQLQAALSVGDYAADRPATPAADALANRLTARRARPARRASTRATGRSTRSAGTSRRSTTTTT